MATDIWRTQDKLAKDKYQKFHKYTIGIGRKIICNEESNVSFD